MEQEMTEMLLGHETEGDISIPVTEETTNRLKDTVFPDTYEIDSDCITPVKKQYVGNCWMFASIAMVETFLLRSGFVSKMDSNENTFSETHMMYSEFDIQNAGQVVNPGGMTPTCDTSDAYSYGGNRIDATSYFARRLNTVTEVIDPNFLTSYVKALPSRAHEITTKKCNRYEVTDLFLLENPVIPRDENYINTIKMCLKEYGIVYLSFQYISATVSGEVFQKDISSDPTYGTTFSYYMNRKKIDTDSGGGHAVAIVGWDDNFNDFAITPPSKGAFKVKNSWGTGGKLGEGYAWISYEDYNLGNSFCITGMQDSSLDTPSAVYTHSNFCMNCYLPDVPGEFQSVYADTFTVEEDAESVIAVGLCNMTPCTATVELTTSGSQTVTLLSNTYLSRPGFHRIDVTETPLGARSTDFMIKVTYNSVGKTGTYIPIEYKYSDHYSNLDLSKVTGSVMVNGSMQTIQDYNTANGTKYGNLPVYLYVKGGSQTAKDISLAYDSLSLPAVTTDGLLDDLPSGITPAAASAAVSLEWRAEPYNRCSYDPTYTSCIQTYQIGSKIGLMNTSSSECEVFLTTVIGSGKYALKKMFSAKLPAKKQDYSFTVGSVSDGNKADITGTLSGVEGATVKIECNNSSTTVKSGSDGSWSAPGFRLYNVTDGGWKDSYANSTVTVLITDDNGLELFKGTSFVKLEQPFTVSETGVFVAAIMGGVGLLAGLIYCAYNAEKYFSAECAGYSLLGAAGSGESLMEDISNVHVDLAGSEITTDRPLCEVGGPIKNATFVVDESFLGANDAAPENYAVIAKKMAKNSTLQNCTVKGSVTGAKSMAGMFYEGEDVTVENCSVNLKTSCTGDFGGVAHTLTGASVVKNSTISISDASGAKVGGIAVNLSGTVSNCQVAITSSATAANGGICCSADNAAISDVLVCGSIAVADGSQNACAAGISPAMMGSTVIKNCLITGKINAGTSGTAYGIAPGISDNSAAVAQCVCVPSFITGTKAYRISENTSTDCVAYSGIVNSANTGFSSAGETLMNPSELLTKSIFTDRGFDMTNVWSFDDKKCIPSLVSAGSTSYAYPFPCPYQTQSGKYQFAINSELALYGAANSQAQKMTWGNLSPLNSYETTGDSEFQYLAQNDEFYLQMHLMFTAKGQYQIDIISVIDDQNFTNTIILEIVAN